MNSAQQPGSETRGPVPEDNLPGHHPEVEQDKPKVRLKVPFPEVGETAGSPGDESDPARSGRFAFAFEPRLVPFATAVAVSPRTSGVDIVDGQLTVRFGFWSLTTPLANVAGAQITGPYRWWKVAGPPHVSLADRGVTFATATRRGVCINFVEAVASIDPLGLLRHPAATVTVEDPEALVALLAH